MAKNTLNSLKNESIYQVFVRQHSDTKDFKGVINDLKRIKDLGFDYLYLLPFHPIGEKQRKGSIGSPYSIKDYYEIDPLYGTMNDFIELVDKTHENDMKIMIDIVFNHTSRDSKLLNEHPKWFYKNENGDFANRVGDWSDITDLDFNNKDVWKYLAEVLKYWAKYVDGFRCDVAPLIPIEFWDYVKKEVATIKKDITWLTESVELGFIKYIRDLGYDASSDSTMYDVFDICYDYDIFKHMDNYLLSKGSLSRWLEAIMMQEAVYPKNYVKLRSFENHDQERIASKTKSDEQLINLTAMQFFIKGMPMIYAGQEHKIRKRPDLFEYDVINWDKKKSIEPLIKRLNEIKKDKIMSNGIFNLLNEEEAIFSFEDKEITRIGIFNLDQKDKLELKISDGVYTNIINNEKVIVKNNLIDNVKYPIIIDIIK